MLVAWRKCVLDTCDPSASGRVVLYGLLTALTMLALIHSELMKVPIAPESS